MKSALFTPAFKWVWVVLAVLICMGVVATLLFDWRWALVTAMLILVLAPGIMALLYLSYAMSPRCIPDSFPHSVTFRDKDFTVLAEIPPLPPRNDNVTYSENESGEAEKPKYLSFTSTYAEIKRTKVTMTSLVIYLKGNPPGIIHIPYNTLENSDIVNNLIKKCQKK